MKKFLILLLCLSFILSICGCAKEEPVLTAPAAFYYRTTEMAYDGSSAVIGYELRESAGYDGKMLLLLNAYLNGPTTEALTSPFPRTVRAVDYTVAGTTAIIELSNEINKLSGVDLTIACACLSSTVLELNEDLERIQIRTASSFLDGSSSIIMDRSSVLLLDNEAVPVSTEEPLPTDTTATQ